MRHPSLIALSHDHHHGLALALRCRKQALGQLKPMGVAGLRERAQEFVDFYRADLIKHFRAEEGVLFPLMRETAATNTALVEELIEQHQEITKAIGPLEAGLGLSKLLFDIGDLLERHIRKEERELFPLFETQIEPARAETIGAELNNILSIPAH
jgi:iron-sulfur cluster repair protein YtfE (RIC family)